jgi:hypothetical protein
MRSVDMYKTKYAYMSTDLLADVYDVLEPRTEAVYREASPAFVAFPRPANSLSDGVLDGR